MKLDTHTSYYTLTYNLIKRKKNQNKKEKMKCLRFIITEETVSVFIVPFIQFFFSYYSFHLLMDQTMEYDGIQWHKNMILFRVRENFRFEIR